MKHWLTTMLCIVFAASMQIYAITEKPTINSRMQELEIQRKQLSELGLWAFFNVAQSNQWTAPKIHSQCWVDWLPEDQEKLKKLEQGRRDFGLEIVKAVEREALRTLLPTSTVERVNQANRLLDFSSWAGAPDGYGNLAIKRRVEHLACIPIGHLIADLDYSVEKIENLLARFEMEKNWFRMQIGVLNEESPHKYDAMTKDELAVQWHGHFRKAWLTYKETEGRYPHRFSDGKNFPKEIAFYCEDQISIRPYTLATKWNQKRHFLFCVRGKTDAIMERVQNLLLFRKTIGRFPEKPSRPLGLFDSSIQEGFYEAWKPHEAKLGIHPGASGYTYEAIRKGAFIDYDTSELVSFIRGKSGSGEAEKAGSKAAE